MPRPFSRLPSGDADESRYYSRMSLDLTESSYEEFRAKTDTESLIASDNPTGERKSEGEENSAPLRKSLKQYSKLVWWMLAMSTAILYSGYDSVILGQLNTVVQYEKDFGEYLHTQDPITMKWEDKDTLPGIWLSMWDGIGPLGQMAGTVLGGFLLDRMGRRFCLLLGSFVGAAGILALFLANKPADKEWRRIMILIGKVIQGLGLGVIKIETFTYMSEVVPVSLKGAVMSLVPTTTLLGQLIGAVVVKLKEEDESTLAYLIPMASQWGFALPPLLLAVFLPESPAYLLKKRDPQGALKSLTRLIGSKNNPSAALSKMQATLDEDAKMENVSYMECFNASNRRRTFITIYGSLIEFFFGLALLSNVSYFLKLLGMSTSKASYFMILAIVVGLFVNLFSSWTVSHIGRRKLVTTTLLITTGLWAVVGFAGIKKLSFTPYLVGGTFTAIVIVCGLGCWPASYVIVGETSSLRLRAKSSAIGNVANSLAGVAMNFLLPILYNRDKANLGAKTGFLMVITSGTGAVLMYVFVPELKNRSAQEINHLFEKGVRSIGSSKWKDTAYEEVPLDDA